MNKQSFSDLAEQGYTYIPVYREVAADLDTPLSAYLKLANCQNSFLFESVQGGERWGRYSIIGLRCHDHIQIHGTNISLFSNGSCIEQIECDDPLQWIDDYRKQFKIPYQATDKTWQLFNLRHFKLLAIVVNPLQWIITFYLFNTVTITEK